MSESDMMPQYGKIDTFHKTIFEISKYAYLSKFHLRPYSLFLIRLLEESEFF